MPKCKGCQAEIIWIKTINGKNMPCNEICHPVATALIRANCADMAYKRKLTTVAQLERAISGA